jgi:hypothetical protein
VPPGGCEVDVEQPVAEVSGGAMHERGVHPSVVERRVAESSLVEQVDGRHLEDPVDHPHDLGGERSVQVGIAGQCHQLAGLGVAECARAIGDFGVRDREQGGVPLAGSVEHRE